MGPTWIEEDATSGGGRGSTRPTADAIKVTPRSNGDSGKDAKTRANRENARKSTGPRTDAGRTASSKNAVKYLFFVGDLAKHLSGEQFERYQSFIEGIVKDLHPVGDMELHLAQRVADIQFRLELLRTAELKIYMDVAILSPTMEGCLMKTGNPMGLASLYDQRFQRSFSKTLEEFRANHKKSGWTRRNKPSKS